MKVDGRAPVLVDDDDESYRAAVVTALSDEGVPAVEAANGKLAIEYLLGATVLPRLILLDLNMPVMSGVETIDVLRGYLRFADVPIAVVTDEQSPRDPRLGTVALLSKLFSLDRLLDLVQQFSAPLRRRGSTP